MPLCVTPLSVSFMETAARGITAPVLSVILPDIVAPTTCAWARTGTRRLDNSTVTAIARLTLICRGADARPMEPPSLHRDCLFGARVHGVLLSILPLVNSKDQSKDQSKDHSTTNLRKTDSHKCGNPVSSLNEAPLVD